MRVSVGTPTPLTNYFVFLDLLAEHPAWSKEEVSEVRHRFVEALIKDVSSG